MFFYGSEIWILKIQGDIEVVEMRDIVGVIGRDYKKELLIFVKY